MLDLTGHAAPLASRVQADLARLPFARASAAGAWACNSYVHLPATALPFAWPTSTACCGSALRCSSACSRATSSSRPTPRTRCGRSFSAWPTDRLRDVLIGAGFTIEGIDAPATRPSWAPIAASATRARTLPDTVGPGMRLLVCGLNPSVLSADVGIGFARNGNRYWPAALAAGLVTVDRDPRHAARATTPSA